MMDQEKQEIRDIYVKKDFKNELLDELVNVITSSRKVWIDNMMREELSLFEDVRRPFYTAATVFHNSSVCSAMHNIHNIYPLLLTSLSKTMSNTKMVRKSKDVSPRLLKRPSRIDESGISKKDISDELELNQKSVKRLLKSLAHVVSSTRGLLPCS